jgi:hypothetical protein
MPVHLTDRAVKALAVPTGGKKDRLVFDDLLPCLAVRVSASGRKIFLFQARQKDGRQIRQAIGRFPTIATATARDLARAKAGRIASGADSTPRLPRARRRLPSAKPTRPSPSPA